MTKQWAYTALLVLGMTVVNSSALGQFTPPSFGQNFARWAEVKENETSLNWRGVPLDCYLRVGPPSPSPGPMILMAEATSAYLAEVALAYGKAGKVEEAVAAIAQMDHDLIPYQTLVTLAENLAMAGEYQQALQLTEAVKYREEGLEQNARFVAKIMAVVAREYAQSGNREKAAELFSEAIAFANNFTDFIQASALAEIAGEYAAAGEGDRAIELTQTIEDETYQSQALGEIARGASDRQLNDLLSLANGLADNYNKIQAFNEIAKAVKVEQLNAILQGTNGLTDEDKSQVLATLAERYAAAGEFERALQIASGIAGEYEKGEALTAIAVNATTRDSLDRLFSLAQNGGESALPTLAGGYSQIGEFDRGLQIAQTLADDTIKAAAIAQIASNSSRDRLPELVATANQFEDEYLNRADALGAISLRYAQLGEYDAAIALAKTINSDSAKKVEVLTQIAEEYMLERDNLQSPEGIDLEEVQVRATLGAIQAIAQQYTEAGNYRQALELYDRGLQRLETIDTNAINDPSYQEFVSRHLFNLKNHYILLVNCAINKAKTH